MSTKKAPKNKPLPSFLRPKGIKVVTRKVLETIADGIHNPKTGHYLNLCTGTLQNGPDPVCETRQMHCGLGELYFVVTGRQPEEDDVNEADVVDEVVGRSTIGDWEKLFQKQAEQAKKAILKTEMPDSLCDTLIDQIDDHIFDNEKQDEFAILLNRIPKENDMGKDNEAGFKARAKRIATTLREAAKLLPR